ncbi:aldose 1-epimerase [Psychromicrobium silvestre]|uniref:Aldose 1-epimerase n=1 Tax=Psychromicrobium silvestre TaxID=1645614 RepID=A0A7Y9LVS3_9MICC|nr:aldose 1-epimerase family protein [Psychromicrobium silvestre]NYE96520.1 aldose 1-epimerase [Psychromicrobium silvestre]
MPEFVTLTQGAAQAVISLLAAALRSYSREGVQLTEPSLEPVPPGASGITLAPWPNRIDGGRWTLEGQPQQLDITEVARGHAIHGLLRNSGYTVLAASAASVELAAWIYPQHGYPFELEHRVEYRLLADESLWVQQSLRNASTRSAPVALGAHPYLRLGELPTEELELTVRAEQSLQADERLIPSRRQGVTEETDLRAGRKVAELEMDRAYTQLAFDERGVAVHTLQAADGRSVSLWQRDTCQFVHIYVSTGYPGRNKAVAIEPMSAPANAFNSGEGLRWLEPEQIFSIEWGIQASL